MVLGTLGIKKKNYMLDQMKPIKIDSSIQRIFFTSDLHFGHQNILKFCNRPWETTEEMDEELIERWNSAVGKNDLVFNLGDFAFAKDSRWKELISRLNGIHYLVLGNHDVTRWPGNGIMRLFAGVYQQLILKIDKRWVYLNHYPFLCYGGSWRGPENAVYALHGHVHSGPDCSGKDCDRLNILFPYQYDVGVDNNNYTPVSWEEVQEKIAYQIEHGVPQYGGEHTIPDDAYKE